MIRAYGIPERKNFFSRISATNQLIIANVVFYFASIIIITSFGEQFFLDNFALTPGLILQGKTLWTLITSMFSHLLFFHVFANMFSLFFIGNFLERIIGRKRFFLVYLISGLIGGMFFVVSGLIFNNDISGVGASGAIFGLLGVLAVLVPYSKIYLIAGPLILILLNVVLNPFIPSGFAPIFDMTMNILIFLMIFSLFSLNPGIRRIAVPVELRMWLLPIIAIVPLVIISFFVPLPIGNSAHIGGLLVGLLYGFYLRQRFPNKTRMLSRHFQ
ncbi:rhomboid family intramembrane serine protease [Candidatus Pacearchaeota archaeon]|nr:rhomboid family intramembrane serine protease [Candidatus Pacearchaeota archaeon]